MTASPPDETEPTPEPAEPKSIEDQKITLTLHDYLELRDRASTPNNVPAIVTAVAGAMATVITAIALLIGRGQ